MPTDLQLAVENSGGVCTMTVRGEVDISNADLLVASAHAGLGEQPCTTIIVEVSGVTFLDCAGLTALLKISAECKECSTGFVITNASPFTCRIVQLAGLDGVLPLQ